MQLVDREQKPGSIRLKMGGQGAQHVREPPRQVGIGVIGRSQADAGCSEIIDRLFGQILGVLVQVLGGPMG